MECEAEDSMIYHRPSGKKVSFGSVSDLASKLKVPKKVNLKDPINFSILGKDMLRADTMVKINGTASYAIDTELEGMVYAMVERPSSYGATYVSSNAEHVNLQPEILDVLVTPRGVAIVGKKTWSVIQARKLLKVKWKKKKPINNDSKVYIEHMEKLISGKAD